ncbi:RNA-binding (RRM/RBD/RNP motifs) family protein [Actinidia rufa]|uniref:RNA-binding (RRM/RBD/RNP motifs) family protein n=1 Tax=Actinidia rufa TaxID=165716 RepID=A0A7J0ECT3_9ERIC|nr:RNA-binding (RRM/RBD/RNP motifs) family protein [Actinidia rufa]
MRPIFCGNFDYDARQSDLERLFKKYGKVDRVDMKSGFAFVYMDDERDAEDAIRGLDRMDFGRKGRRLRVEWTKQERGPRRPEKGIFAFIQYESQEDAIKALDATNMSKLMDRVISVEYAIKDDDDRRNGHSPDRSRDRSPGRRGQDRGQSLSPYRRERASPDYGRGRSPSPYRRGRASPDYGRGPSPSPHRKEKTNSDHGRSPRRERHSPDHGRERSPRQRVTPDYGHGSPSPQRERINRDNYQRDPSPDSKHELRDTAKYDGEDSPPHERYRSRSPLARERSRS